MIEAVSWTLEASPQTRCVLLGRRASINCLNNSARVTFAQNIQWFKILSDGQLQLISHSLSGKIISNAHQLQFKSTTAKDEGLYCCKTISEPKCSPKAITNITISLPPILPTFQNQTVQIGETITVNCTTTNGEPTTFIWQKYGKNLPNDPKYSIIQSKNTATLTITNVTTADEGHYNCIVRNRKYQQDNQSLYLHVKSPLGK